MSTQVAHILADVGPILAYVVPICCCCCGCGCRCRPCFLLSLSSLFFVVVVVVVVVVGRCWPYLDAGLPLSWP